MGGQLRHPDGALIEQREENRQLSQREVAGLGSMGVAAAEHREHLGQHALQLTGQLADLGFRLPHNSPV